MSAVTRQMMKPTVMWMFRYLSTAHVPLKVPSVALWVTNVRGRFSARWEEGDGYVEATQPGVRALGGRDGYALRGQLQIDVDEATSLDLSIKYSKDDDVPTGGYVVFSQGGAAVDPQTGLGVRDNTVVRPFEHDSEYEGYFDREATSVTAKLTKEVGDGLEFVSITNYTEMDKVLHRRR